MYTYTVIAKDYDGSILNQQTFFNQPSLPEEGRYLFIEGEPFEIDTVQTNCEIDASGSLNYSNQVIIYPA